MRGLDVWDLVGVQVLRYARAWCMAGGRDADKTWDGKRKECEVAICTVGLVTFCFRCVLRDA